MNVKDPEKTRFDPKKHHRRSIRLKGYDYSQSGAYFVTICTYKKLCLLGDEKDEEMDLNDAGRMVWKWWYELENKYRHIQPDRAVVMPNHFHGIILIHDDLHVGAALCGRPIMDNPTHKIQNYKKGPSGWTGQPHRVAPTTTLGDVIDWFKTMTTNAYIRGVKHMEWKPFPGKLWQRNYYEHIIRNEEELNKIREYIIYNPLNWALDKENPTNWKKKQ